MGIYDASLVCTTLDNSRSTILLSKSPHSTSHRSPSWKFSKSAQPSNKRRRFRGTLRPDAVVIDRIFLVRKVAMTWILCARLAPVSLGAISIHTRCSSLIDCTVIWRFSLLAIYWLNVSKRSARIHCFLFTKRTHVFLFLLNVGWWLLLLCSSSSSRCWWYRFGRHCTQVRCNTTCKSVNKSE